MNVHNRLRDHIADVPLRLRALSKIELTQRTPGKWSRKEILGHLIDSSINNLKRFTDAQFADGLYTVQGYNQNQLVVVNRYHELPIDHLLALWQSLNRQILYVIQAIPDDTLTQSIQVGQAPAESNTLAWLIEDYIVHLEHHLKTLL